MTAESPTRDHVAEAIAALTSAARGTRTVGAGTPNEHQESVDFGEIACHVITAAAANLGSVEDLLAGRPGSWESAHVRDIVTSTAGDGPDELLRFRTEPLRVVIDVDSIFSDLGLRELYEEAEEELRARHDDVIGSLFDEFLTPDEATHLNEFHSEDDALAFGAPGVADRLQAAIEIHKAVLHRATESDHPLIDTLNELDRVRESLEELWEADQQAYRANVSAAMRQYLQDRGLDLDVEVLDIIDPVWTPPTDGIDVELHRYASATAALPMTGKVPELNKGSAVEELRAAGLTYLERATRGA